MSRRSASFLSMVTLKKQIKPDAPVKSLSRRTIYLIISICYIQKNSIVKLFASPSNRKEKLNYECNA